jgi:hypothetical protein
MSEQTGECSHDATGKYLVCRGSEGHYTGFLVCEKCLTDADFKLYPGWKERLETKDRKAAQLDQNLGRVREEVAA